MRLLTTLLLAANHLTVEASRQRWVRADKPGSALEATTGTEAFMRAAGEYLSASVAKDELHAVKATPLVVELEKRGVLLEEVFGWLALSKQQKARLDKAKLSDGRDSLIQLAEPDPDLLRLGLSDIGVRRNFTNAATEDVLKEAGIAPESVDVEHAHTRLTAFGRFHRWLEERENVRQSNSPISTRSPEQFREWRRRQAFQASGFFSHREDMDTDEEAKANELLEDSLEMTMELDSFLSFLNSEQDVDWTSTHRRQNIVSRSFSAVRSYFARLIHNTAELFRQTWRTFTNMLRHSEQRCVAQQSAAEESEARRVGLTSGVEMLDNSGGEVDDAELERQIGRTEEVLSTLEAGQEQTEAQLDSDVHALRAAGDALVASATSGTATEGDIQDAEDRLSGVANQVCTNQQHTMAGRLLQSLRTLRAAVGATLAIALPGYGMRGLSGMAGLQGGYEEVYDFRHREIGYFRWGVIDVGPSVFGLGIGSYTSIGWKGYKVNWTLQDAYQTGICKSEPRFAPGITLGGPWSASLGLTYCTDADNSGSVWLPEPHGVNGVVFSNGISANLQSWVPGLATANGYLNALGADYQMAKYWMFTSECFDTLGQFLRGMYKTYCASCRGFTEHARLGALRTITHIFGFPLATEMLHTFIAWQYDRHVVPDGYERPCSDLSTRNRREPENVLRAVSRELHRSTELLDQIETKVQEVQSELLAAVDHNPELTESREWEQLTSAHHFCARHPMLPATLAGAAKTDDQELTEDVREQLRNRTRDELITACRRFRGIRRCSWRSKESLVDALAERATVFADAEEPFGRCNRDSDCPLANQECGRVNGVRQCVCSSETCHRLDSSGTDHCTEEQQGRAAVEHVTSEMRAFVLSHRIDVGEYILEVQRLSTGV